MADLKPCPFCEGAAEAQQHPGTKLKPHVTCVECGADITETTIADAIHRWNTRTPLEVDEGAIDRATTIIWDQLVLHHDPDVFTARRVVRTALRAAFGGKTDAE